jgi:fructose-bisphosphate aldolase class I
LKAWSGNDSNLEHAQKAFSHRAIMNMKASLGEWSESLEA